MPFPALKHQLKIRGMKFAGLEQDVMVKALKKRLESEARDTHESIKVGDMEQLVRIFRKAGADVEEREHGSG